MFSTSSAKRASRSRARILVLRGRTSLRCGERGRQSDDLEQDVDHLVVQSAILGLETLTCGTTFSVFAHGWQSGLRVVIGALIQLASNTRLRSRSKHALPNIAS